MTGNFLPLARVVQPRRAKVLPSDYPTLRYIGLEHIETHTTRLLGCVPATEMRSCANHFQSGDVLYSRLRPYLNKIWRADHEGLCSSEFIVMPGNSQIDPDYLCYRLNASDFVSFATRLNTGDRPRVDFDQISVFETWLPDSLDEQRRIVAEIEKQFTRLEAGVAALRRVQANLKRYRASVLKAACEGRLVPTRKKEWKQIALGDVVESMKNGLYKPRSAYADHGIACLRMYNIENGKIVWRDIKRMVLTHDDVEAYRLLPGDLLVNRVNSRELVGKSAPIPAEFEACVFESKNIRVRLKRELANPDFIGYAMSVYGPPHFNRNAQQVVGMASISQPQIGALQIPLPPLAEQEQIVAEVERRLSVIERAEATVTVDLQRAARLRQSILQQAFSGKLVTEAAVESVKSKPAILALDRAKRHFRRAVLSAEIVHRLHAEPTFGRTKHQKVFHLCEHIAQIEEIEGQYHREAAGPLDNKLIYANEAELKKQQWFETVKRQPFGHAYRPMGKAGSHRTYLERYWPDKLDTIAKLIDLLRTWNTESCEIFSTVYAAWNDLILWGREATDDAILHQILNCWHESKQQISRKRWLNAIARMRKMGYVPTGFGKPTAEPA